MFVFAPVGPVKAIALIGGSHIGIIDPDYTYANRLLRACPFLEIQYLVRKITLDPVNLFDHRFCEDFNLDTDFNCRYRATRNLISTVNLRYRANDQLTKCAVASSSFNALPLVLYVEDPRHALDGDDVALRFLYRDQVFV